MRGDIDKSSSQYWLFWDTFNSGTNVSSFQSTLAAAAHLGADICPVTYCQVISTLPPVGVSVPVMSLESRG